VQLVQVLLHAGANMSQRNIAGQTALHLASMAMHCVHDLLEYLRQGQGQFSGSDIINLQDHQGCSSLHTAAFAGHGEAVRHLLAKGANSRLVDDGGAHTVTGHDRVLMVYVCSLLSLMQARIHANCGSCSRHHQFILSCACDLCIPTLHLFM
jgi:Ankyrin repeats (3 copies)